jgi:heme exporter protein C
MGVTTVKSNAVGWRGVDVLQLGLGGLTVASMAAAMWLSLAYAPAASNLAGDEQLAQRIFYVHMDWDRVAQAAIEVGLLCGIGTILTGMFWAKPTWNTYWTWDPRLTTSMITVLVYLAYLLFRNGIDDRSVRARFGSIYAIVAFLSVPLTFYSARLFRSIHPVVYGAENADAQGDFRVGETMTQVLSWNLVAFCILFSALVVLRWRQLRNEDALAELREEVGN